MRRALSIGLLALGLVVAPSAAFAQDSDPHHPTQPGSVHAEEAQEAHGGGEHEHVPSFDNFNWVYGLIGEKEGVEPNLLFRPKGMPVPFAAQLLNAAILYWLLYRMFGKSVRAGLKKRKEDLLRGMEEAAKMKREAEEQLAHYEARLAGINQDIARIREQSRTTAESDRARVLKDAKEARARMERDAHQLVEAERKAARARLLDETITSAVESATAGLSGKISEADQLRFAEEYLNGFRQAAGGIRGQA